MKKSNVIARSALLSEIIIFSYLYVIFFYIFFQCDVNTIIYSLLHVSMAIILLYNVLNQLQYNYKTESFSLVSMTILITVMYFYVSSIKYTSKQLGPNLISDNNLRLLGTFIVFLSILIADLLWFKYKKHKEYKFRYVKIDEIKINTYLIYLGVILLLIYNVINYINNPLTVYDLGTTLRSSKQQVFDLLYYIYMYFILMAVGYYFNFRKLITYIPISIFIFTVLFRSFTSGSRASFLFPFLGLLYVLLYFKKIKIKYVIHLILIAPLLYPIFSLLVFIFSGRAHLSIAQDIAYRFDFSDFPMTVMNSVSYLRIDFGEIFDGFVMSVPSAFYPLKTVNANATQIKLFMDAGLPTNIDYTDSVFSMGAEIGGVIGMIFLYPIILLLFECVNKFFTKKGAYGFLIKMLIYDTITRIEIPWVNFIPTIRDKVICIFLGYFIYKVTMKYMKSNHQKLVNNVVSAGEYHDY